jgi:hypothetical protein
VGSRQKERKKKKKNFAGSKTLPASIKADTYRVACSSDYFFLFLHFLLQRSLHTPSNPNFAITLL